MISIGKIAFSNLKNCFLDRIFNCYLEEELKTYLITGGAGFIGSHFVEAVLSHSDSFIINLDKPTYAGSMENLSSVLDNKNHIFIKGDICDRKLVAEIFE